MPIRIWDESSPIYDTFHKEMNMFQTNFLGKKEKERDENNACCQLFKQWLPDGCVGKVLFELTNASSTLVNTAWSNSVWLNGVLLIRDLCRKSIKSCHRGL